MTAAALRRTKVRAWLLALALVLLAQHAQAADLPWRGRAVRIDASEKPLPDFLRELAASQSVTAVIDPKVGGIISGKFVLTGAGTAQSILDSVCSANGLTWYYDGAFLYIDLASDAKSEVLHIAGRNAGRINDILRRLKIADSRYPVSVSEQDGNIVVSGPRRYVEMVRQTIKQADQRSARDDDAEIRVFALKYAWAADFKLHRSGGQVTVPGVVSVLRSLFSHHAGFGAGLGRPGVLPFQLGPSRQIKLSGGETVNAPKIELPGAGSAGGDDAAPGSFAGDELPQFHADTRMNAVLVRDIPERMARYERLVQAMDVRPRLIEIEVAIMDVSTDSLDSLGVDWRLHGRRLDLQTGRGDQPALNWNSATTEAGQVGGSTPTGTATTPLGALFSAALGSEARHYLLARVHALAQKGNANFIARPKVMTLDNTEAVLENRSEFYVRVGGFQDASLFKVNTGTAVRVTPLIVDEAQGRGVMMSIDIEDGDISAAAVDQIPIVRRRAVNTQALIDEGTSLLIAGYTSEEKTSATTGVPLLSSLPLIGKLFQVTEKKQLSMERFYLLTPRLVLPGAAAANPLLPNPQPGG